jgi:hypothetical protein
VGATSRHLVSYIGATSFYCDSILCSPNEEVRNTMRLLCLTLLPGLKLRREIPQERDDRCIRQRCATIREQCDDQLRIMRVDRHVHRILHRDALKSMWETTFPRNICSPNEDFGRPSKHSGTYFQSTFQIREYSIWATLI